ncbi:MAG TPA: hypothetical protein VFH40_01910, partial [Gemmatimonadales bacterium]|nr:hypothetical protein [Gemmatimonadales bacterium]
ATTPNVSTHRTLKLDRLKPGNYVLEVVVTDAEGRKDRRTQEFQVVEEKETKKREGGEASGARAPDVPARQLPADSANLSSDSVSR